MPGGRPVDVRRAGAGGADTAAGGATEGAAGIGVETAGGSGAAFTICVMRTVMSDG